MRPILFLRRSLCTYVCMYVCSFRMYIECIRFYIVWCHYWQYFVCWSLDKKSISYVYILTKKFDKKLSNKKLRSSVRRRRVENAHHRRRQQVSRSDATQRNQPKRGVAKSACARAQSVRASGRGAEDLFPRRKLTRGGKKSFSPDLRFWRETEALAAVATWVSCFRSVEKSGVWL
jgi:hypothetical protein